MVARAKRSVELEDKGADVTVGEGCEETGDIVTLVYTFDGLDEGRRDCEVENVKGRRGG